MRLALAQVNPIVGDLAGNSRIVAEHIEWARRLGAADYVHENGFGKVVIGLSGGVDSALIAAIAVDALGKQQVAGVAMPSPLE